jgi:glycerol-3-phosphate acyltransferase PlsY
MSFVLALAAIVIAYLLGSLPMGVLAARIVKGVEIREVGSGRTGATNAYRAAGPWGLALTSLGDIGKGIAAVWVARFLMFLAPSSWAVWIETLAGIAAVVGHNWSIFLRFKGGAGTATTVGILAAMNVYVAAGITAAGIIALAIGRMASIASLTIAVLMGVVLAIIAATGHGPWAYVVFGVVAGVLTIWALRPNIRRISDREERQLQTNY